MYAHRKPRGGFDPIADQVGGVMRQVGMSRKRLAERTGLHREQISTWLGGKRPLRVDYLVKILDELGLEILPANAKRHLLGLRSEPKAALRSRKKLRPIRAA